MNYHGISKTTMHMRNYYVYQELPWYIMDYHDLSKTILSIRNYYGVS